MRGGRGGRGGNRQTTVASTPRRGAGRGNAQTTRKQAVKAIQGRVAIKSQTIVRGGGTPKRGRAGKPTQQVTTPTRNKSPAKSSRGAIRGGGRGGRTGQRTPQAATTGAQKQRGGKSTRGSRGTGRGGSGRGGGAQPKLSKEDLDKQLDQYMSKTRTSLDKDLENYMSLTADVDMN